MLIIAFFLLAIRLKITFFGKKNHFLFYGLNWLSSFIKTSYNQFKDFSFKNHDFIAKINANHSKKLKSSAFQCAAIFRTPTTGIYPHAHTPHNLYKIALPTLSAHCVHTHTVCECAVQNRTDTLVASF